MDKPVQNVFLIASTVIPALFRGKIISWYKMNHILGFFQYYSCQGLIKSIICRSLASNLSLLDQIAFLIDILDSTLFLFIGNWLQNQLMISFTLLVSR